MHSWGDWPDERFDEVDQAGWFIGWWLRRWARMGVIQTKEKFGTVRVYCHFGCSSFYELYRPGYCWVPKWWPYSLDLAISKYLMPVLNTLVIPVQKKAYRWRYGRAVRKWPHLACEILHTADYGEILRGLSCNCPR